MLNTMWASEKWNGSLHVHPVNDVVRHEFNLKCVCGPSLEAAGHGDGWNFSWAVVHHAADSRTDDGDTS